MKKLLILSLLYFQSVFGDQQLEKYYSYLEHLSFSNGNYQEGEIEIITDPPTIFQVQFQQEKRLLKKGLSAREAHQYSRIGIICEDQYWIWIRDAVYFPQGVTGTYNRMMWKSLLKYKPAGVAVLPILPNGHIVLILTYRHASRSWELELPRGGVEFKETIEEGTLRELKEETGLIASSITFLGEIATDTGVISGTIPVYLAKISSQEESGIEDSEAIACSISFTKEQLKEGLMKGFLEVEINGIKKQIPLRDAFLTFALLQAEIRQLL